MTSTIAADIVENIFQSFLNPGNPLTIKNLMSVSLAMAQTVMREVVDTSSPRVQLVVDLLRRLVDHNAVLTANDRIVMMNAIDYVIPHALVFMTQIEQGCIVLCGDLETEVTTCWSRYCGSKNKVKSNTSITTTTTTQSSSSSSSSLPLSTAATTTATVPTTTTLTRSITDPLKLKETSTTRLMTLTSIAQKYHPTV